MKYIKEYIDFENWDWEEEDNNLDVGDYVKGRSIIYWNSINNKWTIHKLIISGTIIYKKYNHEITEDELSKNIKIPGKNILLIKLKEYWPWFKIDNFKKID